MKSDRLMIENFINEHPLDAARILEQLSKEEIGLFLNDIPVRMAALVLSQFEPYTASRCLEKIGTEKAVQIAEKLPLTFLSVLLRQVNQEFRDTILTSMPDELSISVQKLLDYPEDSAAAQANPSVLTLTEDISVKAALERVQKQAENLMFYMYILNRKQILSGVFSIGELMQADPKSVLSEVMHRDVSALSADLPLYAILNHPGWKTYYAMPVVTNGGIFLGAIDYNRLRSIEGQIKKSILPQQAVAASSALGELYQIGFSGLLRSATTPFKDSKKIK